MDVITLRHVVKSEKHERFINFIAWRYTMSYDNSLYMAVTFEKKCLLV